MKLSIILLGVMAIVVINSSTITSDDSDLEWILFVYEYKKSYKNNEEYEYRKSVFAENFKLIAEHNELYRQGRESYELTINTYSDLTHAEFARIMNGFIRTTTSRDKLAAIANISIPHSIDYRTKGYVTPVQNQGSCSSAWAFSAAGAIEGQIYRLTKKLIPLSPQNLIDCSSVYENHGCEGGSILGAFHYISNVGINSEADYPYAAVQGGQCRFDHDKSVVTFKFGLMAIHRNETLLKTAVGLLGPVAATIDVSQNDIRSYKSGVYYNANCSSTDVNHAVLVVGYGTDKQGRDYWIVKNSWGREWGDRGYVLMARNRDNNCGIATSVTVPML